MDSTFYRCWHPPPCHGGLVIRRVQPLFFQAIHVFIREGHLADAALMKADLREAKEASVTNVVVIFLVGQNVPDRRMTSSVGPDNEPKWLVTNHVLFHHRRTYTMGFNEVVIAGEAA